MNRMNQFGSSSVIVKILNNNNVLDELIDKISYNFPDLSKEIQLRYQTSWKHSLKNIAIINKVAYYSDIIRIFILAAYGGIHIDCEVLILQSLYPLLLYDYYYRWSYMNYPYTAILHLQYKSNNTRLLLNAMLNQSYFTADFFHPQTLFRTFISNNSTVQLLPSAYFDPLWITHDIYSIAKPITLERYMLDSFTLFFEENPIVIQRQQEQQQEQQHFLLREQFFPGSFAFNWHSQWHATIKNGSIGELFMKYFIDEQQK